MIGSNYYGETYYGQGPAVGTTFVLKAVTASVSTVASISSILLVTKIISATVVAAASVSKQFQRSISATVSTIASIADTIVKALNIRRATTKLLTFVSITKNLNERRDTKNLNLDRITLSTTED